MLVGKFLHTPNKRNQSVATFGQQLITIKFGKKKIFIFWILFIFLFAIFQSIFKFSKTIFLSLKKFQNKIFHNFLELIVRNKQYKTKV